MRKRNEKGQFLSAQEDGYTPARDMEIVAYLGRPLYQEKTQVEYFADGTVKSESSRLQPLELPTLEGFAREKEIELRQVLLWQKGHESFQKAVREGLRQRRARILENALLGLYSVPAAKLLLEEEDIGMETPQKVTIEVRVGE